MKTLIAIAVLLCSCAPDAVNVPPDTGSSGTTSAATTASGTGTTSSTAAATTTTTSASTASAGTSASTSASSTSGTAITSTTSSSSTGTTSASSSTSSSSSTTGGLPTELELCDLDAGCNSDAGIPLQCEPLDFTLQDGGTFTVNECVQTCGDTSECLDAVTSCQFNVCYFNFCASGAKAYSACNSAGTGDGQCTPEPIGGGETTEVCVQTGPSGVDAVCGDTRGTTGPALCVDNATCITPQPDGGSWCFGLCDVTGSLECDAGTCVSLGIPAVTTGVCIQTCSTSADCPQNQDCGPSNYCVPKSMEVDASTAPPVPAAGEVCNPDAGILGACAAGNACITPDGVGGTSYCYQTCGLYVEPQCSSYECLVEGDLPDNLGFCITPCNPQQPCDPGQTCSKSGWCEP